MVHAQSITDDESVSNLKSTATTDQNGPPDKKPEPKVVDEIESLCMNCHENARIFRNLNEYGAQRN